MIGHIRSLFRSIFYGSPKKGDLYVEDTTNPFKKRHYIVLDAQKSWVKYRDTEWLPDSFVTTPLWLFHTEHVKSERN